MMKVVSLVLNRLKPHRPGDLTRREVDITKAGLIALDEIPVNISCKRDAWPGRRLRDDPRSQIAFSVSHASGEKKFGRSSMASHASITARVASFQE
ncbi:MAG: hypothetical protein AAYR33_04440 [Acetobacteraceae bacterium]